MKYSIPLDYSLSLFHLRAGLETAEKKLRKILDRPLLRPPWCLIITIKTITLVKPSVIAANITDALKKISGCDRDPHIVNIIIINEPSDIIEIFAGEFKDINKAK